MCVRACVRACVRLCEGPNVREGPNVARGGGAEAASGKAVWCRFCFVFVLFAADGPASCSPLPVPARTECSGTPGAAGGRAVPSRRCLDTGGAHAATRAVRAQAYARAPRSCFGRSAAGSCSSLLTSGALPAGSDRASAPTTSPSIIIMDMITTSCAQTSAMTWAACPRGHAHAHAHTT